MRKRITGRRLVPVALAAASVLAMAAPATAAPPDPLDQGEVSRDDCLRALKVLSILHLLPDDKPGLGDALCDDRKPKGAGKEADADAEKGSEQEAQGAARDGQQQLFGIPELPKSLTIRIPGLARQQH
ncbi:hypothetical protein [Actinomadura terrae]|uniref:hypothetical protein n=1 Tax=Actinomadura terrae TaxID=604353 RepID=UPI001FA7FD54|nr:hypothetical protein [Actinomadura terrae]